MIFSEKHNLIRKLVSEFAKKNSRMKFLMRLKQRNFSGEYSKENGRGRFLWSENSSRAGARRITLLMLL